jgi:hypothetical protein
MSAVTRNLRSKRKSKRTIVAASGSQEEGSEFEGSGFSIVDESEAILPTELWIYHGARGVPQNDTLYFSRHGPQFKDNIPDMNMPLNNIIVLRYQSVIIVLKVNSYGASGS